MKTSDIRSLVATVAFLATACGSSAIPLTQLSSSYVGHIVDGIPSGLADEAGFINILTTLAKNTGPFSGAGYGTETYDRLGSTLDGPFAAAITTGAVKDDTGGTSIDASGFAYVLGKYDATQAGSLVWYVSGGFTGQVTLPDTLNGHQLSHVSLYKTSGDSPIPGVVEGGNSVALLGLAIVLLAVTRRWLTAA